MDPLKILSIDPGIINLGYVFIHVIDKTPKVIECGRVNITLMRHSKVKYCSCTLHHDFCIPDYLDHFVQEHQQIFDDADVLLLERQPPQGLMNVQDLLFSRFRNKVKLISPNSLHKHFKMDTNYLVRKEQSEKLTEKYLDLFTSFNENDRKHDISDALLLVLYYIEKNKPKVVKIIHDFEQYRYTGILQK